MLLLATLNHPKIAAIYGLEDAGQTRAIVMELVEGDTLADRLGRSEDRPLEETGSPAQETGRGRPSGRPVPMSEALAIDSETVWEKEWEGHGPRKSSVKRRKAEVRAHD